MPITPYVPDPAIQFTPWRDGEDRVAAGGSNGFNVRFQALETEFKTISGVIGQIGAALDALQPGVQTVTSTFTPNLVAVSPAASPAGSAVGPAWIHGDGTASISGSSGVTSADGMMNVQLPDKSKLTGLVVIGTKTPPGPPPSAGSGRLQVFLRRGGIDSQAEAAPELMGQIDVPDNVSGFFGLEPPGGVLTSLTSTNMVDASRFHYFIRATITGVPAGASATLFGFSIITQKV